MTDSESVVLGDAPLTLDGVVRVARKNARVTLGRKARERMEDSRRVVDAVVAGGRAAPSVYAINTGFGALAEVRISPEETRQLQKNFVRSHAAGVGEPLSTEYVRAMILLRAAVLAMGYSGVRPLLCDLLCAMLERNVHPVIPSRGSLGASGDLAPLAHLALVLVGEGSAEVDGQILSGSAALKKVGLEPIELAAKECLSLTNGTQHMTALGALNLYDAAETCALADIAGAMSLDALRGSVRPFDERVQGVRGHPGQLESAALLRTLLTDSEIIKSHVNCGKVQDAYSLRCMPQVHGASRDTIRFATHVLEKEVNACTDNPLVFVGGSSPFGGDLVSGGNFHGQPVAIALDAAAIGLAELANISERRVEQLLNPHYSDGLPPFLAPKSGLNSGFMVAQYSAAALISENKILCHPASVDSIPTSAGREDHVSMGATSALKLARVHDHVRTVLCVELLAAAQGLDLRAPLESGPYLKAVHKLIRTRVPMMQEDRPIHADIAAVRTLVDDGSLVRAAIGASS